MLIIPIGSRDQLLGTLPHSAPNQRLLDVLWAACLDESDNLVENWKNSEYSLEWNTEDQNTDEHMDQSEAEDEVAEEDNDESDSSDKEAAKDRSIALTKTQTHGSAAVQLVDIYISRIASSMGPSASEPVHDEGEESLTPEPESAPTTDSEEAMPDSDLSSISFDDGHSRSIWFGTKFILRYFNVSLASLLYYLRFKWRFSCANEKVYNRPAVMKPYGRNIQI